MKKIFVTFLLSWICFASAPDDEHWTEMFIGGWFNGHIGMATHQRDAFEAAWIACSIEHGSGCIVRCTEHK